MFNKLRFDQHVFNEQVPARKSFAEAVDADDVISFVANYIRAFAESISLSDVTSRIVAYYRTLYDNINVASTIPSKIFNRLKKVPTILSASAKRFFAGSSFFIRPERG